MSLNRENIIWPAKNGTFNIGFWAYEVTGDDPEWDVEYLDHFHWVSSGHSTADAAFEAWDGANPGGSTEIPVRNDLNEDECERLDQLLADCKAREQSRRGTAWR